MSGIATIRASVFAPILAKLENDGVLTNTLLARHGLVRDHLDDPYAVVPLARYIAFFEEAAALSNTPNLGALLGNRITPGDLGPAGLLFTSSPSILEALDRLGRSLSAIQGSTHCGIGEVDGDIVWSYQISNRTLWPRRQDSEFSLSVCCQLIRLSFSRNWAPLEVHFEHPEPSGAAMLARLFRSKLRFGQSTNRLVMRGAEAVRVQRSEDPALRTILEHHIADLAQKEADPETLSERVRSLIATNLGYRQITVAAMAQDLGMAPRTFQRRLQEEGTSLREMVELYRKELAEQHGTTRLSKRHIADTLGYADATVFWRARRRWAKPE